MICMRWSIALIATAFAVSAEATGDCRRVSSFGYDPEDSTRFLQAALDSGGEVVIDRQDGPWFTRPLVARSGNRIVLEPGVEVVAKKGAFHGSNDYLLHIYCVTNVSLRGGEGSALRMRRDEYAKAPYKWSEWRHALRINRSANVTVENLSFLDSGGDGIVIGGNSRDVTIRNCVCDRNYRQGISLCAGENVLIENTVMANTAGTPPTAGIDFEPDGPDERLVNCVLRNCLSQGNGGNGFEFYFGAMRRRSMPVSILLENCRSVGNRASVSVIGGHERAVDDIVTGSVCFRNCRFESAHESGIVIKSLPTGSVQVAFKDCVVSNAAAGNLFSDVCVGAGNVHQGSPDGLTFDRLAIYQPKRRPWFSFVPAGNGAFSGDVKGKVAIVSPDGARQLEKIDRAWTDRNMPSLNGGRPLPSRMAPPAADEVELCDSSPGASVDLAPVALMCGARCVFFAPEACPVRIRGRQIVKARGRRPVSRPFVVTALGGSARGREWKLDNVGIEATDVVFNAPERGFYSLTGRDGGTRYLFERSNVPIAIDVTRGTHRVAPASGRRFSLYLPAEDHDFFVYVGGSAYYRFQLEVFDPAGCRHFSKGEIVGSELVPVSGESFACGLWRMVFSPAENPLFDWIELDLFGASGFYFLSEEKTWRLKTNTHNQQGG